jgi:hypothetical protein
LQDIGNIRLDLYPYLFNVTNSGDGDLFAVFHPLYNEYALETPR